ncbi:MAG: PilT/PilU family type 4a pilus ATPase [Intestinibaculum porci]|uniref:type IV pilus twitching motility protein PilT n=1 Tax=Intestinibaculum porci TaxID=2487118 RepID=UPI00240A5D28|nr:PilT/PilU family type 4a pilus ATPase [Intestinibaculum porci]MDD6422790.1 PilT/PilU family type 4a pilus ATPase [Intestinibaculum porci]
MKTLIEILETAKQQHASDIFIVAGQPITIKVYNQLITLDEERMVPHQTHALIQEIYDFASREEDHLQKHGDDDFSFAVPHLSRFRVSTYKQRGSLAAVIRMISFTLPDPKDLHIPQDIIELANINKGMLLVTGPAGSGKSTTQACMIDYINKTEAKHIITLEDPIEHLHSHNKSIVSQREITIDSESYISALRAALRQAPDVILLGEMRDYETINTALTAAETGHTLISTLHTLGAATTIDRIIDVFPAEAQHQVAVQLSLVLETVISQQLLPTIDGKLMPVFEVMTCTPAIRNMIRDNKVHQIDGMIVSSADAHMRSMDNSILDAYKQGLITKETALMYATNPDLLSRKLR